MIWYILFKAYYTYFSIKLIYISVAIPFLSLILRGTRQILALCLMHTLRAQYAKVSVSGMMGAVLISNDQMCHRISANAASSACPSRRKQAGSPAMGLLSGSGRSKGSMLQHKEPRTPLIDSYKFMRKYRPARSRTISKIWPFDQAWGISIDSKVCICVIGPMSRLR